jgi:hypothetical protein
MEHQENEYFFTEDTIEEPVEMNLIIKVKKSNMTPEYQRNYYNSKYREYHQQRYQEKKEALKLKYEQEKDNKKQYYQDNKLKYHERYLKTLKKNEQN